jgi:hypothetical protein
MEVLYTWFVLINQNKPGVLIFSSVKPDLVVLKTTRGRFAGNEISKMRR